VKIKIQEHYTEDVAESRNFLKNVNKLYATLN